MNLFALLVCIILELLRHIEVMIIYDYTREHVQRTRTISKINTHKYEYNFHFNEYFQDMFVHNNV